LRASLGYARKTPYVHALLVLLSAAVLFTTIPIPVEVVLTTHTLHGGAGGYGALLSAWGAGAVVGSLIYARWRSMSQRALITLGVSSLGAGLVVMALAPSLGVAIGGAAIGGVGNGTMFVASRTALQEAVEPDWMAMMMSLTESIIQGLPGVGILVGGALAAAAGPRAALAVGGIGALATGVAVWVTLRRAAIRQTPSVAAARGPGDPTDAPPEQTEPASVVP
jgi:predicted MFS family arabinose efflux permease